uniref:ribonuclease H n=1 Tax=Sphaeramia orbicularis TaxID=375764 RepID=A0A672Y8Q6_9TELE
TNLASAKEAWRHAKHVHRSCRVLFLCTRCAGYRLSLRQAITHAPKCKPRTKSRPKLMANHNCKEGSKAFSTLRGLSLHRRRAHLDSYLQQHGEANSTTRNKSRVLWSDSQLHTLKAILDAYPDNKKCVEHASLALPTYNKRQIQYRCKVLRKIQKRVRSVIDSLRRKNPKIIAKAKKIPLRCIHQIWLSSPKMKYKMRQEAAEKSVATLATEILDGRSNSQCNIDCDTIHITYKGVWERADVFKTLGQFVNAPLADNSRFSSPISEHEVVLAIIQLDQESASGPDGLKKTDLLQWDPNGIKLAKLFDTLLVYDVVPVVLKRSRTVLIPKTNDPDQLSPMLQRLFSGILTDHLSKACSIHPRQRGFIKAPGCAENLLLLKGVLELCKQEKKSIAVVFIDFAKAFDTVSHSHIDAVLERRGVDELIKGIIKNSYKHCYSRIQTVKGPSKKIFIRVGVKQGDPMSPLLFNLALDPLLHKLQEMGKGFDICEGSSVSAMAYADDLVLLSNSWEGMRINLKILDKFAELTGLAVNPAKCHSFLFQKGKPVVNASWTLRGQPIHSVGPSESVKYLGVKINPWKGFLKPPIRESLWVLLNKVSEAKVKPSIKLDLLRTFVIPRLFCVADFGMVSKTLLEDCDRDIRTEVRKWFHLHPTTANGLLYVRYCDGGLSMLGLSVVIPATQTRRQVGLLQSTDVVTRFMANSSVNKGSLLKNLKSLTGGMWNFKLHGDGVGNFRDDKISNCLLQNPVAVGFTQSEFILGLKLQFNSLPVKASVMYGANEGSPTTCRVCHTENETFRHVMSRCNGLKAIRMRRHNNVCKLLGKVCQDRNWRVVTKKRLVRKNG